LPIKSVIIQHALLGFPTLGHLCSHIGSGRIIAARRNGILVAGIDFDFSAAQAGEVGGGAVS